VFGDFLDVADPYVHHGLERVEKLSLRSMLTQILNLEHAAGVLIKIQRPPKVVVGVKTLGGGGGEGVE